MESLGAVKLDYFTGIFQTEGNVGLIQTISLLQCVLSCLRNKMCLTLFFKNDTNLCILHSKTFYYKQPTEFGVGWEAYQIQDCKYTSDQRFRIANCLFYINICICQK